VQDLKFDENKNKNKLFFRILIRLSFLQTYFSFISLSESIKMFQKKNISKSLAGNQIDQSVAVFFSEKANLIVLFMIFKTVAITITT
jgi:hypothetical protein